MKESFIALGAIIRKELIRIFRIWVQTLVPPVITISLYFLIFGGFIGSRIEQIDGYSYTAFIAPGLIMMSIITNSYANTVSSFFNAKFQRHIEELLVSPTPIWVIIFGYVTGGIARGLGIGVMVGLISLFFVQLPINNLFFIVIFAILTSFVFSLAGMINATFAKKFDDISVIPTFVITPLTYLGGVFYPVSLLPDFWQIVSKINPIVYMVNGFRYGFLGIDGIDVWPGVITLVVFAALLFAANYYILTKGLGIKA